jgi:hypothetical protein
MDWRCKLFVAVSLAFVLTVFSCSRQNSPDKEAGEIKTSSQRAAEAIEEYAKRPVDKARKAQSLGEERTRAIDEATENLDKR